MSGGQPHTTQGSNPQVNFNPNSSGGGTNSIGGSSSAIGPSTEFKLNMGGMNLMNLNGQNYIMSDMHLQNLAN